MTSVIVMVADSFVDNSLKKPNAGHGEAKLYIGCNEEVRFALTQKPLKVSYSETYLQRVNSSNYANTVLSNIKTFEEYYKSTLIAVERVPHDPTRCYIGAASRTDKAWNIFRKTLLSQETALDIQEQNEYFEVIVKPSSECSLSCTVGYSRAAIGSLTYIEKTHGVSIQHALKGGEFCVRTPKGYKCPVDGYDKENNTIYEFYGDYFHGNPKYYKETDLFHGIPYSKKWERDAEKRALLESLGFKVVTIWESDWTDLKKRI